VIADEIPGLLAGPDEISAFHEQMVRPRRVRIDIPDRFAYPRVDRPTRTPMLHVRRLPMSPLAVLVALAAVAAVPAAPASAAPPEWPEGVRMTRSVESALIDVRRFCGDGGKYGCDGRVCVAAGFLKPDERLTFRWPLDKGKGYAVVAATDASETQIDLRIDDPGGTSIVERKADTGPAAEFVASRTGTHAVTLRLTGAGTPAGAFVTLFLLRKNGWKLTGTAVESALGRLIEGCAEVSGAVRKKVAFHRGDGQWALYGAALEPDEAATVPGVRFGKGERLVLAAGDANAEDVDLAILNDRDEVLLKDKTRDPVAFLKFTEDEDETRAVQFRNARSRRGGRALVLAAVLRLDR
jgi:hypothetical protein